MEKIQRNSDMVPKDGRQDGGGRREVKPWPQGILSEQRNSLDSTTVKYNAIS